MRKTLVFGIVVMFLLAACGGLGPRSDIPGGPEAKYFEGMKKLDMNFVDRDSPPDTIYYYSDNPDDNKFDITVELWNRGAATTRGGLYVSGYDPNFIHIPGIHPNLGGFGVCNFEFSKFGTSGAEGKVVCDAGYLGIGENSGFSLSIPNLASKLGTLFGQTGWDRVALLGDADFTIDVNSGEFYINLLGENIDLEYGSGNRFLIALLPGVDFTRNFGTEFYLDGNTPEFPGGDVLVRDWVDAEIKSFPPGLDETHQTFLVTACYLYSTHAAPIVCIDPSPFSVGNKVCQPTPYKSSKGQGSPVAITSVKQNSNPRQAVFDITVKNIGGGTVWDPGKIEKCSPYQGTRISSADHNIVYMGQIRISGDPSPMDCVPYDYIRLDRDTGEGQVTCKYDIPFRGVKSAYQTPLVVELWYGYEDTIKKTVRIKRAT